MQAVVLAGGRGQRLHPLTASLPKPLVPILGRPLLGYLLRHLRERGIREVFVTAGYLGSAIAEFVAAERAPGRVRVVREASARGTAGAVADLLPELASPFLVVSGDAVIDLDLAALAAVHHDTGAEATICAAPVSERLRFGVISAADGLVRGFVEKPSLAELLPGCVVNTGCYLLERAALRGVAADGAVDFALDVFPRLLGRGGRIAVADGLRYWWDIGTADAFRDIHQAALRGDWPWEHPGSFAPEHLAATAEVVGPVAFGRGVTVGAGARLLGPLYLGDGVAIGPRATAARSVLLAESRLGAHAEVADAVLAAGGRVPAGTAVTGAIIGRARSRPRGIARPAPKAARPQPREGGVATALAPAARAAHGALGTAHHPGTAKPSPWSATPRPTR